MFLNYPVIDLLVPCKYADFNIINPLIVLDWAKIYTSALI